jgi:hypothetical protein
VIREPGVSDIDSSSEPPKHRPPEGGLSHFMITNQFSSWLLFCACLVFYFGYVYNRDMMIRIIYAFFLGLLLVLFIGMGIQAFYPAPKYPEPISSFSSRLEPQPDVTAPTTETQAEKEKREAYDQAVKEYQTKNNKYNRDVSIIVLGFALILLVTSLLLVQKINVIADGLLLGGIFNLLYSIGRGFATDDQKYQFFIISFGLIIAFILGYFKFIRPAAQTATGKDEKSEK